MQGTYPEYLYYTERKNGEEQPNNNSFICGDLNLELKVGEDKNDNKFLPFCCTFPDLLSDRCRSQLKNIVQKLKSSDNSEVSASLDDNSHPGFDLRNVNEIQQFAEQMRATLPTLLEKWAAKYETKEKKGLQSILESSGMKQIRSIKSAEELCGRLVPIHSYIVKYKEPQSHPLHVDDCFLTINICIENLSSSESDLLNLEQSLSHHNSILQSPSPLPSSLPPSPSASSLSSASPIPSVKKLNMAVLYGVNRKIVQGFSKQGDLEVWHPKVMKMDCTKLEFENNNRPNKNQNIPQSVTRLKNYSRDDLCLSIPPTPGRVTLHFGASPHYVYPLFDSVRYSLIIWYDLQIDQSENSNDDINDHGGDEHHSKNVYDVKQGKEQKLIDLPVEIVQLICSFLPKRSISAFARTCKKSMKIVDCISFWRRKYAPKLNSFLPYIFDPQNQSQFTHLPLSLFYPSLQLDLYPDIKNTNNDDGGGGDNEKLDVQQSDGENKNENGDGDYKRVGFGENVIAFLKGVRELKDTIWKIEGKKNKTFSQFRRLFSVINEITMMESRMSSDMLSAMNLIEEIINECNHYRTHPTAVHVKIELYLFKQITHLHHRLSLLSSFIQHLPWYMQDLSRIVFHIYQFSKLYADYNCLYEEFQYMLEQEIFKTPIDRFDAVNATTYGHFSFVIHCPRRRIPRYQLLFQEVLRNDSTFLKHGRTVIDFSYRLLEGITSSWERYDYSGYVDCLKRSIWWSAPSHHLPIYDHYFSSSDSSLLCLHKFLTVTLIASMSIFVFEFVDFYVFDHILFVTTRKPPLPLSAAQKNQKPQSLFRDVVLVAIPFSCFESCDSSKERTLLFHESPIPLLYNLPERKCSGENNGDDLNQTNQFEDLKSSKFGIHFDSEDAFNEILGLLNHLKAQINHK